MPEKDVKGLILMGGQSIRMGTDKAFVQWQGKTLLERSIENLSGITEDIYLSVNTDQHEALNDSYNCILDKYPDKGPLSGILSALETLNDDLIVLAVDMPEVNHSMLCRLISNSTKVRAYQSQENQWEPLPSFWPKTITEILSSYFSSNRLSINGFLKTHGETVISNTNSNSFKNLNSPDDLS